MKPQFRFNNSWPTEWCLVLGARVSFPRCCHDDNTNLSARYFFGSLHFLCFHLSTGFQITPWKNEKQIQ